MRTLSSSAALAAAGLAVLLATGGCTLKATIQQTTDTTSNMTGTTSSAHSWVTEDRLLKPQYKAIAFVTDNQSNLQRDLAAGHGEYLTSLGTLLGVPAQQQPAYGAAVQSRYAHDLDRPAHTPAAWLSVLHETARPFRSDAADLALER